MARSKDSKSLNMGSTPVTCANSLSMEGEYSLIGNIVYLACCLALPFLVHIMWKRVNNEPVDKAIAYITAVLIAGIGFYFGITELIKHL